MRVLLATLLVGVPAVAAGPDGVAFYESKVRPVLADHCYSCHSATAKKVRGELRLDSKAAWLAGGSSGPAVVPGKPDGSPLVQAVRRTHKDIAAMPPDKALTSEQVADLVAWVTRGAPAPDDAAKAKPKEDIAAARMRWPFTPVPPVVPVPAVKDAAWPATAIDTFVLAKLEAKGLKPVGPAAKYALIRRATFDLTGLPPTPGEVAAFERDESPDAFAKVIDRLLASPHYGERWGRHWLDVVRYADTAGDNSDFPVPQLYLYRNWVIDAVNRDLPFDRFVKEQLAGDLIGGGTEKEKHDRIVATGYIASARRFGSRVDDYPQHLTIEDTLDNVGRAFLGLTLNCARCHDHKFDPLSMADYYALYGVFHSTRYPWPGIELEQRQRDLVPLASAEQVTGVLAERDAKFKEFEADIKKLFAEKGKAADKVKQDEIQKKIDAAKKEQKKFVGAPLPFPTAYAVAEAKKIEDAFVQLKGDPAKKGPTVPRRFPDVLGGQPLAAGDKSSGRLAVANWIASADNPLFARVFVNRVWLHHFGRGLVPTPNDFGRQGTAPTHAELLDYLAREFVRGGWSVKALHRQIMLSRVYQLGSVGPASDADPNNELLSHFRHRRLDAESIRDALLFVGGNLDRTPGGPHPFPPATGWDFTQHKPFKAVYETNRRSVYLMTQRTVRHPYLGIFDGADASASTGTRVTSTTTLQSLYFLNDAFVHDQAKGLAARAKAAASDDAGRIGFAYRTLFARSPTAEEVSRGTAYLLRVAAVADPNAAWESYARALVRVNEFVYLD